MKLVKDYKGVAIMYLILTIISIIWFVGYEKPEYVNSKVDNTKMVAMINN